VLLHSNEAAPQDISDFQVLLRTETSAVQVEQRLNCIDARLVVARGTCRIVGTTQERAALNDVLLDALSVQIPTRQLARERRVTKRFLMSRQFKNCAVKSRDILTHIILAPRGDVLHSQQAENGYCGGPAHHCQAGGKSNAIYAPRRSVLHKIGACSFTSPGMPQVLQRNSHHTSVGDPENFVSGQMPEWTRAVPGEVRAA
jgi:hypothetical protein